MNTEETYPRPISNQTSLVPGKPESSTLTLKEGRKKSRDKKKQRELENYHFRHNVIKSNIILFLYKTKETSSTKRNIKLTNKQINQTIVN